MRHLGRCMQLCDGCSHGHTQVLCKDTRGKSNGYTVPGACIPYFPLGDSVASRSAGVWRQQGDENILQTP